MKDIKKIKEMFNENPPVGGWIGIDWEITDKGELKPISKFAEYIIGYKDLKQPTK